MALKSLTKVVNSMMAGDMSSAVAPLLVEPGFMQSIRKVGGSDLLS